MISTCIAILAVDFHIFPRCFAKTETYGISVMDLGVGAFIVSHALVSKPARQTGSLLDVLRSVSPLISLGIIRLISTKATNYQEHVSEYGIHWNFFFTLAAVALVSGLVRCSPARCGLIGASLLCCYQSLLSAFGLTDYLMDAPRVSLFSANKEGICSSLGYQALYLISVAVGHFIFLKPPLSSANLLYFWKQFFGLSILDGVLWVLSVLCSHFIQEPSRRFCNLSYVLIVLAATVLALLCLLLCNLLIHTKDAGMLLEAINRNQLALFLIANLMTGNRFFRFFLLPFFVCGSHCPGFLLFLIWPVHFLWYSFYSFLSCSAFSCRVCYWCFLLLLPIV